MDSETSSSLKDILDFKTFVEGECLKVFQLPIKGATPAEISKGKHLFFQAITAELGKLGVPLGVSLGPLVQNQEHLLSKMSKLLHVFEKHFEGGDPDDPHPPLLFEAMMSSQDNILSFIDTKMREMEDKIEAAAEVRARSDQGRAKEEKVTKMMAESRSEVDRLNSLVCEADKEKLRMAD